MEPPPFGVAPVLVAALGSRGVWVHFDVTGVAHQPCTVGLLPEWLPPCFPRTLVTPAAEGAGWRGGGRGGGGGGWGGGGGGAGGEGAGGPGGGAGRASEMPGARRRREGGGVFFRSAAAGGRSRAGAAVRKVQNTALRKRRGS